MDMKLKQDNMKKARIAEVLKQAKQEGRGKLTIFLGAAAGVGKTCAMLKAAKEKQQAGVDVLIGLVDTHGRAETEALLQDMPILPLKKIDYRGHELEELDYEGIIQRHPQLVIIDELAHTNVMGSHFSYRYKDIEAILQAGIDVYTALNIQHVASLNDVVAKITGTVVKETVPDEFLAEADAVQLVDIPVEELQKRLQEGKIYKPEIAARALKGFFRQGNISALRELALRYTASHVDEDTAAYMRLHAIDGPWPASGRVMVCAGFSPFASQLILQGYRMAQGLHSELLVVNVETPEHRFPVGDRERERIWQDFKLAHDLGGKVRSVFGEDVVDTILETARQNNVTAIVVGKSRRNSWKDYFRRSLVDKLIDKSESIPVYVLKVDATSGQHSVVNTSANRPKTSIGSKQILYSVLMLAGVTLFMLPLRSYMELLNIGLLYLAPVLISAMWWGRKASYFTALCSILAFEFFFLAPTYTFKIDNLRYIWGFVIFFLVASVVGKRTEKLRQEVDMTARREQDINSLYQFSKDIAVEDDINAIAAAFTEHVGSYLERNVFVLLPDSKANFAKQYSFDTKGGRVTEAETLPEQELVVAAWCLRNGCVAGRSTDTLPNAEYVFFPVVHQQRTLAVVGLNVGQELLSPETRTLLEAWIGLLSMLLGKAELAKQAKEMEILQESDELRTALLNSVSHELRTPLAGIMGAVYTLKDARINCNQDMRSQLLLTISESGSRMEHIIENLLDTARITSGMVQLKRDWCDLEEIIGGALRRWGAKERQTRLRCELPEDLPLFVGDSGLLEHVVLNYVDNAAKYSPRGSEIVLKAEADADYVTLKVIDNGYGFAEADKPHLFEKFYRGKCTDKCQGTGLGLAICRTIIEAHGGSVWAEHREDAEGSIFAFKLPLTKGEKQDDGKQGPEGAGNR
ncbi:MAG: ATP-binding protein [Phascolarctobacterium sp.]